MPITDGCRSNRKMCSSCMYPKPCYWPANSRALSASPSMVGDLFWFICALSPRPLSDQSCASAKWLAWFRNTSGGPETVDLLVIRPHWYWTHDLSLIRAAFGPTELTRNRFKTVSDRGLWCRVKGLLTLPNIISGFLLCCVKGAAADENGHMDRSLRSVS